MAYLRTYKGDYKLHTSPDGKEFYCYNRDMRKSESYNSEKELRHAIDNKTIHFNVYPSIKLNQTISVYSFLG
jgi:hypothetical protein